MRKIIHLFLLGFALLPMPLSAQKVGILNREKVSKLERLLKLYDSFGDISGTVLVAQDGKIIYQEAFGFANQEWGVPNTVDTKFRIGSITKQFTAAIILQLVDEGKLKLRGEISTYLPYYRRDIGRKITIHQLLNHTSGIPCYTKRPDFTTVVARNYLPTEDLVKQYCSERLEFEPGDEFRYSNSNYVILGAIIETVTGKTYEVNLQERILTPLEMTNTGYDSPSTILPKRAAGYQKFGFKYINAMFTDMSIPNAAGGMYSTAEDLFKWERALNGEVLLPQRLVKKMFSEKLGNYGYGWFIQETPINVNGTETTKAYHTGEISGFTSLIIKLLEDNHTIIILCNNDGVPVEEIGEKIQLTLYDMPYDLPRKSIIPMMLQSIEKQGVDVAIEEYKKLKTAQKAIWTFRVNELDDLGKELLALQKMEEALLVFELNVAEFPESYMTYFSLAEVYKQKGEKEKALENYKKALELNPDNNSVKLKLRGLEGI